MATKEKVIDFASRLKTPVTQQGKGFVDFASRLQAQPSGLLPPPERPIRGGVLAQAAPATRIATQAATGEDPSPGVFDFFTGESRQTPETEALPEIMQLSQGTLLPGRQDIGQAVAFLTASNTEEREQMLSQVIPGIQFRKDEKGNSIATLPDGREAVVNKPGFSRADALQIVSEIGKFAPAGRLSALGQTVLKRLGLGALTAGATQAVSEVASIPLGGEVSPVEIGTAAALGGVAEAVGPAISGAVNRARAARVGAAASELEAVGPSIAQARTATKETGIPIFQAQQTGIPAQLEKQSFVAQLPAGTQAALKGLKAQNKAAGEAVDSFLESIGPAGALETGAARFRTAAQESIEALKTIRKERTSPLFEAAFKESPAVDLGPVRDSIRQKLIDFPEGGEVQKSLLKIKQFIGSETKQPQFINSQKVLDKVILDTSGQPNIRALSKKIKGESEFWIEETIDPSDLKIKDSDLVDPSRADVSKGPIVVDRKGDVIDGRHRVARAIERGEKIRSLTPISNTELKNRIKAADKKVRSLRQLQNAKLEIDQMISRVGENSLGNTTKRQLIELKNLLLDQMDEASPAFRRARQAFAAESPAITRLEESILGRVAKLDDTQLKRTSQMIFDAAETNPAILAKAKSVINNTDPEAWNELLRVELERRIGSVKPGLIGTAGESVENIPGQLFRAIFGNDKQTKVLMRALSPDQRKNLTFLQTALRRASLGRPGGSQTAGREEIKQELRGGVMSAVSKLFEPIKALAEGLRGTTFDRRTRVLAEALFDPQWKPRMDKLRKLDIQSPAAAKAMTQLLNDIEQSQPPEPEQIQ